MWMKLPVPTGHHDMTRNDQNLAFEMHLSFQAALNKQVQCYR